MVFVAQAQMVKLLIEHHAKLNLRSAVREWARRVTPEPRPLIMDMGGLTAPTFAARQDCIGCVKELVKSSADVNTWDFFGDTPLYVAIDMNTLPTGGLADPPWTDILTGDDIEKLRLEKGADPNAQLKLTSPYRSGIGDRLGDLVLGTGATPLRLAAKDGDVRSVKLLLEYHALVNLQTARGVTERMAAACIGTNFRSTRGRYRSAAASAQDFNSGAADKGHRGADRPAANRLRARFVAYSEGHPVGKLRGQTFGQ
ncbi:MAG: ankyrin repeat domain-containing protein [Steroidobacteraceae bacterium]